MEELGEDVNFNGRIDSNEPDSNDMDSDDDGLMDGHEKEGLDDNDNDGSRNCLDWDSDNDGIYDGTEVGVQTPTLNTSLEAMHFKRDEDPVSMTDPWDSDSDGDGLKDGTEDSNIATVSITVAVFAKAALKLPLLFWIAVLTR